MLVCFAAYPVENTVLLLHVGVFGLFFVVAVPLLRIIRH